MDSNEKPSRLDDLNDKLYLNDQDLLPKKKQGILRRVEPIVSRGWENTQEKAEKVRAELVNKKNTPLFKKFFIGALIFFALAVTVGFFRFFSGGNTVSSDNIQIQVFGSTFASGGEELPLEISITNKNAVPLEYADLIIEYPRGAGAGGPLASETERKRVTIGTIGTGRQITERTALVLYGEQGSTKDVKFTLEYRVPNSNSIFRKTSDYQVAISSAPVTLTVEAPSTITPNQDVTLTLVLTPNVTKPVEDVMVRVEYPTGFKFGSSIPEPSSLSNIWRIEKLTPGEDVRIQISGTVLGEDGEDRVFRSYVGAASATDKNLLGVVYNSSLTTLALARPFLESKLSLNGSDALEVIATPRSEIRGEIDWGNNLDSRIVNAEITAKITGALLDRESINANQGFYNSAENTIVWNRDTNPKFASVEPGETGGVSFNFASLPLVRADQSLYDNPTITVEVSIKGRKPSEGDIVEEVKGFERKTVKFSTDFAVVAETLRAEGPFANTGPVPPRVEQKTTYTVAWTITNSSSPLSGVEVRAPMPTYVHLIGSASPASENVSLDPVSGDIVWKVGPVAKGTGISGNPKRVYFMLEIIPSLSQVGKAPNLLGQTKAVGVDTFTGASLSAQWAPITTEAFNDSSYAAGSGKVVQ